jgi:nitrogen regulatory protein P-II 1
LLRALRRKKRIELSQGTLVKLIVAIIRPEKLEEVQRALNAVDVYLMTVTDVRGCGRQKGHTEVYRGQEIEIRLLPKLKLEIAVNEAFVEATVEAIVHSARSGETGQIGDGKIFVMPLDDCVRIRTGERGGTAIGP